MDPDWWQNTEALGKEYGDLIFLKSLGQPMVIINSYDVAVDLFEKKSTNYSDRPTSVMVNELQKWDWNLINLCYGEGLRKLRAPVQKFFESSNILNFEDVMKREAQKLLRSLLQSPDEYGQHIRTSAASLIMMITYGHEIDSYDDPFVRLARNSAEHLETALQKGAFLVDNIPWLKYLPKWFPGAGFHVVAEEGARLSNDLRSKPYFFTKEKILRNPVTRSFTSKQIEECLSLADRVSEDDDDVISATTAVCYLAGAATSASVIMFFLMAMTLHPEVQRRAQDEIDRVIGDSRLSELSDRDQLPYCAALLKEIHRCYPILPLGVAHATKEADTYSGYYIPAKTVVLPNHWAMLMDPKEYPVPEAFRPDRFLPEEGRRMPRDPSKIAFGFGRRICPGKPFAEHSLFLLVTHILAVFNISKAKDVDGNDIEPDIKIRSHGVMREPEVFECLIKARSSEASALIQME
ncbi:cytochrome P450 [Schizopora paradoxa]|uniref:Cytochrome P450 n=1 Tax=Schizopora paradoxa TaxID=27342 RepID=A0A0H2R710_9AGAM|nr:cytochrome P450 [Schizopora paradoxa]